MGWLPTPSREHEVLSKIVCSFNVFFLLIFRGGGGVIENNMLSLILRSLAERVHGNQGSN